MFSDIFGLVSERLITKTLDGPFGSTSWRHSVPSCVSAWCTFCAGPWRSKQTAQRGSEEASARYRFLEQEGVSVAVVRAKVPVHQKRCDRNDTGTSEHSEDAFHRAAKPFAASMVPLLFQQPQLFRWVSNKKIPVHPYNPLTRHLAGPHTKVMLNDKHTSHNSKR